MQFISSFIEQIYKELWRFSKTMYLIIIKCCFKIEIQIFHQQVSPIASPMKIKTSWILHHSFQQWRWTAEFKYDCLTVYDNIQVTQKSITADEIVRKKCHCLSRENYDLSDFMNMSTNHIYILYKHLLRQN